MENNKVPIQSPAGRSARQPFALRPKGTPNRRKLAMLASGLFLIALLIALAAWLGYRSSTAATIDTGKYQAVFFTNGQVYFGKLSLLNSTYMKLTDIYYLQAQTSQNTSENPQETSSKSSDVQLIKLGNEVHGPEDEMIINRDQVLFFENLQKGGKVTDSINKFQSQKK